MDEVASVSTDYLRPESRKVSQADRGSLHSKSFFLNRLLPKTEGLDAKKNRSKFRLAPKKLGKQRDLRYFLALVPPTWPSNGRPKIDHLE